MFLNAWVAAASSRTPGTCDPAPQPHPQQQAVQAIVECTQAFREQGHKSRSKGGLECRDSAILLCGEKNVCPCSISE